MTRVHLIELHFTGGGPMDGHHLVAEAPAGEWFELEGGRYQLWDRLAPPRAIAAPPVAVYEWVPAAGAGGRPPATLYATTCQFPDCPGAATRVGHEEPGLCFDHCQLLFYDVEEFLRLWDGNDPLDHP
jgi:hypothetical protein